MTAAERAMSDVVEAYRMRAIRAENETRHIQQAMTKQLEQRDKTIERLEVRIEKYKAERKVRLA